MIPAKLAAGFSMLADARVSEFESVEPLLAKILNNILAAPAEEKFRRLRTSNAKINALLATKGVRAILIGAGFVEEGEFLVLPTDAAVDGVETASSQLAAQAAERGAAEQALKAEAAAQHKASQEKENEKRKLMKLQIGDDAAARKEPGWSAKAAGVKGGREITGCCDIGAQGGGG